MMLLEKGKKYFPVILCVLINLTLYFGIALRNPDYLQDYRLAFNPDAPTYVALGRNIWLHHQYSRNVSPPYKTDFGWTPLYPLLAGAGDILFRARGIFWLNMFFSALTCIFIYLCTCKLIGQSAAWLAALFMALDPILWIYNFEAMSDIPFLFFIVAGISLLLPCCLNRRISLGIGGQLQ